MSVTTNIPQVKLSLSKLQRMMKFANIKLINEVGKAVQDYMIKKHLPSKFTLRGKWYMPRSKFGLRLRFARSGRPEAILGTAAPWMLLQETGGRKRPAPGRGKFAVATGARANPSQRIASAKYVSKIADRAKATKGQRAFWAKMPDGRALLISRSGRGKKGKKATKVEYSTIRSAPIKARFGFIPTAIREVRKRLPRYWKIIWRQEVEEAMRRAAAKASK